MYKVRGHCYYAGIYRGTAHSKCSNDNSKEIEIPIIFHNGSTYDNHFIISELATQFDRLECIGENSEKYISFKASLIKEDENKDVTYKLKFIDSIRFMMDSLDNITNNLSELNKCKNCSEKCNNYKRHNNVLIYQCKKCNKKSYKSINTSIERFNNTYAFYNNGLDKFLLLLRKGVYSYEYINSWNRFNETKLPLIEDFYSKLYNQNITKEDYNHSINVWNAFEIDNLGEYHDLYVKKDVL